MTPNYNSLENEKTKAIPDDVAGWVSNARNSVYHMIARLGYAVAGIQFEKVTKEDIDSLFGKESAGKVYYGYSEAFPTAIDEETAQNKEVEDDRLTINIETTVTDRSRCHWIAWKTGSGMTIESWKDVDNDDVEYVHETVGGMEVYALESGTGYIINTSKIVIKKG